MKALHAKVDEHEAHAKKLSQLNQVLKSQLEQAEKNNRDLSVDLNRLSNTRWDSNAADQDLPDLPTSHENVAAIWSEVLKFRRQMSQLKMSTERDLTAMKGDLSSTGRKMTSACLDVWTSHSQDDDLGLQMQRLKLERKTLEQKVEQLQREVAAVKNQNASLERSVTEEKAHSQALLAKYEKASGRCQQQEEEMIKLLNVSKENETLQNSLQDIALMVDNSEQEDQDVVDLSLPPRLVQA